mgnify:FL=1
MKMKTNNELDSLKISLEDLEIQINNNKKTIVSLQQDNNRLEIEQGKLAAKINYLKQMGKL